MYFANSWAALTDGRLGDYQKIQEEALVILRELHLRESLAFSLSSSAMGKSLGAKVVFDAGYAKGVRAVMRVRV